MENSRKDEKQLIKQIRNNVESCIFGKSDEIVLLMTALLAGGHVLLEDVPGTGKTVMIKALAKSIEGQFRRIQCNPDLLPTDITGVSIYHPKDETFVFRPGPIMTNILLIDEINRATTKTQSALLEAMEERHITVDGECYDLPHPFMLLATQNPIDFEGTYILPEAQLDRFMMKFSLGYPDRDTEMKMVFSQMKVHPLDSLSSIASMSDIASMQQLVKLVHLDPAVGEYAVELARQTREHPSIALGASPRATMALIQAAKAFAFIHERDYVLPDDLKTLAHYVLGHRILLQAEARMEGETVQSVLQSVFQQVKAPVRMEK